jgi:hypothetical protein
MKKQIKPSERIIGSKPLMVVCKECGEKFRKIIMGQTHCISCKKKVGGRI